MHVETRLRELGLVLPAAAVMPAGVATTFSWVRVVGSRVLVSGHGAQQADGSPRGPFGRVPGVVSLEQARGSARSAALSVIGGVSRAVGDLDRIEAWLTVSGFVNAEPGYARTTAVINAFSRVVLDVFEEDIGSHARTAIGVSALPLDLPVVVAAELQLRS